MPQTDDLRPTEKLIEIMARLRHPTEGCPWDIEQDFRTIAPHTIEEAYEVVEAIERGDMPALQDELGDLLFQVVYHARMAEEAGHFAYEDVARAISDKMIRRHPHVFGDAEIRSAEAQTRAWEEMKAEERASKDGDGRDRGADDAPDDAQDHAPAGPPSALEGVTSTLPALSRALKLQKRAARVGFDWAQVGDIAAKIREELAELEAEIDEMAASGADRADRLEEEMGDLLFAVSNLARRLDIDAETALRRGNLKFEARFRAMERALLDGGTAIQDADLTAMEAAWGEVKRREKAPQTPCVLEPTP